jgi:hypothetical protein
MALTQVRHETCQQYLERRLSEGWYFEPIKGSKYLGILWSPDGGCCRLLDLRNDVETLRPNAAGDETSISSQWPNSGSHYDKVDEASADDDSTYVCTNSTSYQRDLYALDNHSVGAGTINSVTIYFRFKTSESLYYAYAKPSQKSGSTVTDGTEKSHKGDVFYVTESQTYTTNPATGNPYTWNEIDNLQIGVSIKEEVSWQNVRCTQVYVEVDYTAVTEKASSDSGSGSDAKVSGNPLASLSKSDSGSGAEDTPTHEATLVAAETGSGMEAILSLVGKLASDTGSAVENSYRNIVEGAKDSSDTGSGTEMSSLIAEFEQIDSGSGIEAAAIYKLLLATDAGTGLEVLTGLLALIISSETGYSSEGFGTKIMTSAGAGDMKLLTRKGKVGIPSKRVNL